MFVSLFVSLLPDSVYHDHHHHDNDDDYHDHGNNHDDDDHHNLNVVDTFSLPFFICRLQTQNPTVSQSEIKVNISLNYVQGARSFTVKPEERKNGPLSLKDHSESKKTLSSNDKVG